MLRLEPSEAPVGSTTFGELLRRHRLASGLTQELLAARAGLSAHAIQKLEHGTTRPYRATVQRLALALELSPDDQVPLWAAGQPTPRHRQVTSRQSVSRGPSYRHNLPTPLTSFIGRERELSDARAARRGAAADPDGRGWLWQDTACARGMLDQAIADALAPCELVAAAASTATAPRPAQPSGQLTPREREVAALVARGNSNRQIGEALVITERTVAAHIEHILNKLGFTSRTQIGVWAAEHRLVASSLA